MPDFEIKLCMYKKKQCCVHRFLVICGSRPSWGQGHRQTDVLSQEHHGLLTTLQTWERAPRSSTWEPQWAAVAWESIIPTRLCSPSVQQEAQNHNSRELLPLRSGHSLDFLRTRERAADWGGSSYSLCIPGGQGGHRPLLFPWWTSVVLSACGAYASMSQPQPPRLKEIQQIVFIRFISDKYMFTVWWCV